MMKIAIITGAGGGLGREFTRAVSSYDYIDEVWAVGRDQDRLNSLKASFAKVIPVCADLSADGLELIARKIKEEAPDIRLLINNAGTGYLGRFEDMEPERVRDMCTLNCSAPVVLTSLVLPYMKEGAGIINISSASSYQPNPYLSLYSAGKVFVKNFSRALYMELKARRIRVTAVCPGWIDTDMLPKEKEGKKIRYTGMISPRKVVSKALKDNEKGRDMSTPGWFSRYFRIYSKFMPVRLVMLQWTGIIRKYI